MRKAGMLSRRGLCGGLGAAALLAGCASPEPALFRLVAVPGTVRRGGPRSIELRRVGVPGYLDRPEIIRGGASARLEVLPNERWGEPLGDLLGRVLAENLTLRLPGSTVFAEGGALRGDGELVVEVEVQRFEAGPAGTVELLAQVALRPRGNSARRDLRTLRLDGPVAGTDTAALVSAMSAVLGRLADALAAAIAPG
ncbi:membrane integrity-associated transporter subunit PqiC [Roseomonas sp. BN140053]|uniref:PqiC family protein n=1 Tax=Roseomonas sp. BN140053 TaxID=3391898 RepID=UPI0039E7371F